MKRARAHGIRLVAAMLAAGLLAGCFRTPYPANWGAFAAPTTRDCPAIAGVYDDVATSPGGDFYRLGKDLFELRDTSRALGRRVVVEQFGDDSLAVAVLAPGDSGGARRLLRRGGDYRCESDGLDLARWDDVSGEGILGVERVRYRLRRATDGALVARRRGTIAVIALMIPFVGSDEDWYRYAPYAPARDAGPPGP